MINLETEGEVYRELQHTEGPGRSKGLVTNYGEGGGATKREGGCKVLPLRRGGTEKVLAMREGGGEAQTVSG